MTNVNFPGAEWYRRRDGETGIEHRTRIKKQYKENRRLSLQSDLKKGTVPPIIESKNKATLRQKIEFKYLVSRRRKLRKNKANWTEAQHIKYIKYGRRLFDLRTAVIGWVELDKDHEFGRFDDERRPLPVVKGATRAMDAGKPQAEQAAKRAKEKPMTGIV